jgi:hypothetical protein
MDKLDTLLQQNPPKILVRKNLTTDTLAAVIQIKRVRLARRMLVGLLVIAVILLLAKWWDNDLGYFLQLALYKFSFIKNQSSIYLAALIESLPKQHLFIITMASVLWFAWRGVETFLLHNRITNTRQTLAMKMIRLTPRLLIVNTLVVITAIGVAGYSYAQKTEQEKLQILREHVNQSGRTEFEINKSTECKISASTNDPNLTNSFEIKKSASLSPEDAKKVIEASCLQAEAENFLYQAFYVPNPEKEQIKKIPSDTHTSTSIVYYIIDRTDIEIVVEPPQVNSKVKLPNEIFTLTEETKVYKNNTLVPQSTLAKGDIVMLFNEYEPQKTQTSEPTRITTLGVFILPAQPEFKWHSLSFEHPLTQIKTCEGNPQDRCSFTGSIDFFPSGGGEGNTTNPLYVYNSDSEMKEIAGVLTEISETSVKIKSSSGRIFTIEFGSNPTEDFNRDRSQNYNSEKVAIGDTLLIRYSEPLDQHATTINTNQIFNAVLMIEFGGKTKPIKKY